MLFIVLTRGTATYAAPGPRPTVPNHTRKLLSVWPWLLQMVMHIQVQTNKHVQLQEIQHCHILMDCLLSTQDRQRSF